MKATTHLPSILIATAVLALTTCAYADEPKKHGTDVLHIATQTRMANAGVLSTASGKVQLHWDKQGKANHQELSLKLKGLDAAATYQLGVFLNGDSNLTQVVTFTANHEGKADIHLREKGPKHSHPHDGHVGLQLPPELQPLTIIDQVVISDTNRAAVLTADLTAPDKFEFLAKRDLSTTDIRAKLEIKANNHKGHIRLEAKGLEPGAEYSLAINGTVAGSDTADADGKLHVQAQLDSPADILALSSVELLDASSNVVVSATFP